MFMSKNQLSTSSSGSINITMFEHAKLMMYKFGAVLVDDLETIASIIKKFRLVPRINKIRFISRASDSGILRVMTLIFVGLPLGDFVVITGITSTLWRCGKFGVSICSVVRRLYVKLAWNWRLNLALLKFDQRHYVPVKKWRDFSSLITRELFELTRCSEDEINGYASIHEPS